MRLNKEQLKLLAPILDKTWKSEIDKSTRAKLRGGDEKAAADHKEQARKILLLSTAVDGALAKYATK